MCHVWPRLRALVVLRASACASIRLAITVCGHCVDCVRPCPLGVSAIPWHRSLGSCLHPVPSNHLVKRDETRVCLHDDSRLPITYKWDCYHATRPAVIHDKSTVSTAWSRRCNGGRMGRPCRPSPLGYEITALLSSTISWALLALPVCVRPCWRRGRPLRHRLPSRSWRLQRIA